MISETELFDRLDQISRVPPQPPPWTRLGSYLLGHPSVGMATLILVVVVAFLILAPVVTTHRPYSVNVDYILSSVGTAGFPLGTDSYGRDVWSRMVWGGRISIMAGVIPAFAAMVIGLIVGLVAGYIGAGFDQLVMALTDILLSFPFMLLALVIVAVLGPSLQNAMIAVIISTVPRNARLIRGETLSVKEQDFIEAARVVGCRSERIMRVHVVPNVLATALTVATTDIALMIMSTSGLSFLGLGVQPPQVDWGTLISDGRKFIVVAPHLAIVPILALFVTTLCFVIIGDAVRDHLNPAARSI